MLNEEVTQNREDAGFIIAQRLSEYKNGNVVVVAIPHGGVPVGSSLARNLGVPFEVMPCRKITHPAEREKTIASVSADEILLHNTVGIPSDYIYHQTVLLRNAISRESAYYYGGRPQPDFYNRVVILVDDVLKNADTMLAALRSIRRKNPIKIIVAVSVVVLAATPPIIQEADDFIYLQQVEDNEAAKSFYVNLPKVEDEEVRDLLNKSNDALICFV
ncbi:MAG: phosphoribosyltransferase family protein [Cyclobacteriaceae bacterium]